jgi:hypothetical protein
VSDDELSRETRALLGAARGADDPGDGDRDRVRARVLAAIGAGAAGTAGTSTAKAAPAAAGTAGLAKLALLILAVGVAVTGAYFVVTTKNPAAKRLMSETEGPPLSVPLPSPDMLPKPEPEPEPEPEIIVTVDDDAAAKPARVKKPRPATPEPEPAPAPSPADSLKAERALLAKATAALRAGDPDAALAAVGEHQKKFPHGVLEEERAATNVLALCATGRTSEGKKSRDRFLTAWPRSVHATRVRAACDD